MQWAMDSAACETEHERPLGREVLTFAQIERREKGGGEGGAAVVAAVQGWAEDEEDAM